MMQLLMMFVMCLIETYSTEISVLNFYKWLGRTEYEIKYSQFYYYEFVMQLINRQKTFNINFHIHVLSTTWFQWQM
jgi:hypothetical protein